MQGKLPTFSGIAKLFQEVLEARIVHQGPDPTGRIFGGHVRVNRLLIHAKILFVEPDGNVQVVLFDSNGITYSDLYSEQILLPSQMMTLHLHLDHLGFRLVKGETVQFLPLGSSTIQSQSRYLPIAMFFILRAINSKDRKRFCRTGHFLIQGDANETHFGARKREDGLYICTLNPEAKVAAIVIV